MPRKIKPSLIRLPGFVPAVADVHPSPPIAFVRESSEIVAYSQQDLLDENQDPIGLENDHSLLDESVHFDHDIPERVCLRALLARAVC